MQGSDYYFQLDNAEQTIEEFECPVFYITERTYFDKTHCLDIYGSGRDALFKSNILPPNFVELLIPL